MGKRKWHSYNKSVPKQKSRNPYWIQAQRDSSISAAGKQGGPSVEQKIASDIWICRKDIVDDLVTGTYDWASEQKRNDPQMRACVVAVNEDMIANYANATSPSKVRDGSLVAIHMLPSSQPPFSLFPSDPDFHELPNGDNGDGVRNQRPETVDDKYWAQRKRFFAKYDAGCSLGDEDGDGEGWYSVTPESIAVHIADRLVGAHKSSARLEGLTDTRKPAAFSAAHRTPVEMNDGGLIVLDAFCGVGGNSIPLALHTGVSYVVSVDNDVRRLVAAARNCAIYQVSPQRVCFVLADAVQVMSRYRNGRLQESHSSRKSLCTIDGSKRGLEVVDGKGYRIGTPDDLLPSRIDSVFLSPPWGGSNYERRYGPQGYRLDNIQLTNGSKGSAVLRAAVNALPPNRVNLAFFLPRSINGIDVAHNAQHCGLAQCVLEENRINGKLKAVTMYSHEVCAEGSIDDSGAGVERETNSDRGD